MAADPDPLADLLVRAGLGDREAFRQFYEQSAGHVYALGMRMLGDASRAEDLMQDVYLKAWHRAGDFRPGRGAAMAWLVAMARNRAIDMRRAAHRQDVPLDAVPEPEAPEREPPAGDRSRLEWCIGQLDGAQRQSIFCAFFGGLSHSEIARHFDEPVGTVKARIRRGLASLARCLQS